MVAAEDRPVFSIDDIGADGFQFYIFTHFIQNVFRGVAIAHFGIEIELVHESQGAGYGS